MYGAVFAYAMYVLAQLIAKLQAAYRPDAPASNDRLIWASGWPLLLVFACVAVFTAQHVGQITKWNAEFPMRRSARYGQSLLIAAGYLAAFALLEQRHVLAWAAFGLAVGLGGPWCNQVQQEYKLDETKVALFAGTQRTLHYVGGLLFCGEAGVFLIQHSESPNITDVSAVCFGASFVAWVLIYLVYPPMKHGPQCNDLLVNAILPEKFIAKLQETQLVDLPGG